MRYLIALLFTFAVGESIAQIDYLIQKDSCYFRWQMVKKLTQSGRDTLIRQRITNRQMQYATWECGKELGIVDCNRDLSYDEEMDLVFLEASDFSNISGSNKPFTGTCESCHINGRKHRRIGFVNGREDGFDTTFYESGCPQVIRSFSMGKENGKWMYFYDSTSYLAWEENYVMTEKDGRQIYFAKPIRSEEGIYYQDTLKFENYKNGVLHGAKVTYYKRDWEGKGGSIKREVNYNEGVLNGAFKIYNLDGIVVEELNYNMGKKDQQCTYYYEDGTLLKTEVWSNGIRNGKFTTFYYQGHLQKTENYEDGVKEGWFKEYYSDEKLKRRVLYEADVLIEEYKYDESGRQVYVFPQFNAGGAEDDAAPGSEESIVSRQKFLKSHRKRVLKEAKKLARQKRKEDRRNNEFRLLVN